MGCLVLPPVGPRDLGVAVSITLSLLIPCDARMRDARCTVEVCVRRYRSSFHGGLVPRQTGQVSNARRGSGLNVAQTVRRRVERCALRNTVSKHDLFLFVSVTVLTWRGRQQAPSSPTSTVKQLVLPSPYHRLQHMDLRGASTKVALPIGPLRPLHVCPGFPKIRSFHDCL